MQQGEKFGDASTLGTSSASGNSAMAVTGDIWRLVPLIVTMAYASPTVADNRATPRPAERDFSIHGAFNNGEDFTPTRRALRSAGTLRASP